MTADRNLRIRRSLARFGLPMLQLTVHTRDQRKYRVRDAIVTKLIEDGQRDVLAALVDGRVTIDQLVALDRAQQLSGASALANVLLAQPLWETVARYLPQMGRKVPSRKRYATSLAQLRAVVADETLPVRALEGLKWAEIAERWPNGPSDWNHVRRMLSRFLTLALGSKQHPTRHAILAQIPLRAEPWRVPDVSPAVFAAILAHVRVDLQPVFRVLVGTGLRVRTELLRMDASHVLPHTRKLKVPLEGKTGFRLVSVGAATWPFIAAAIPAPRRYQCLYRHWRAAAKAAGHPEVTIHDLRHCHGQWAVTHGAAQRDVQTQFGHKSPKMTARYVEVVGTDAVADALDRALEGAEVAR